MWSSVLHFVLFYFQFSFSATSKLIFSSQSLMVFLFPYSVCSYFDLHVIFWSVFILFLQPVLFSFKNGFLNLCCAFVMMNVSLKSILTLLTVMYCNFILFFLLFSMKILYIFMHLFIARQVILFWLLLNFSNLTAENPSFVFLRTN